MFGFFKGKFSMSDIEFETNKEKQDELAEDKLTFSASAGEEGNASGQTMGKYIGKDEGTITKLKKFLKMMA